MGLQHDGVHQIVERRGGAEAAREVVERAERRDPLAARERLGAHAAGERPRDSGDDHEDRERDQVVPMLDVQRVDGLREEEIVRKERRDGGRQRGSGAEAHGDEDHRAEEEHRATLAVVARSRTIVAKPTTPATAARPAA